MPINQHFGHNTLMLFWASSRLILPSPPQKNRIRKTSQHILNVQKHRRSSTKISITHSYIVCGTNRVYGLAGQRREDELQACPNVA